MPTVSEIVIIEEDAPMRSLISEWLTMEGYRVKVAEGGSCETARPDLVIADVCMPRDSGLEQLRRVRGAYLGVPVIAISAQFRGGLALAGAAAGTFGVDALLAKPFDRNTLLRTVQSIIGLPGETIAHAESRHAEPAGR